MLMVASIPFAIYKSIEYTRATILNNIRITSAHTLNLVVENLHGELARFQALPPLLAADPAYRVLWDKDKTRADVHRINLLLEKNKNITGALVLYILDKNGQTIAASNWRSKRTFIGANFSFRPYFREAMQGLLGRYFALGTTSKERGYYFSWAIREAGEVLGVMVCKIAVGHFERAWQSGHDEIVVADQNGIIFLSSKADWLYGSLSPLSSKKREAIALDRQYAKAKIHALPVKNRTPLANKALLIEIIEPGETQKDTFPPDLYTHETTQYLTLGRNMPRAGWQVHILARTDAVQNQIQRNAIGTTIFLFAVFTAMTLLLERARRIREGIEIQQQARAELQHNVEMRTQELQKAQGELVQAGRLAALGKISAGLSHELNQPLAAIRSYADNAELFLQRGQSAETSDNLKNIGELTERMARIIKHLRTYASKDKVEAGPTDLLVAVREAITILAHRIDKENVTIIDELPQDAIIVHGGLVRLQQVFVNIVNNSLDALSDTQNKQIILTLEERDNLQIIEVCDTGPGLTEKELEHAFDPFFSTKEVGKGVGLGLSISYGIIQQFGGHIEIANCDKGRGAALKVALCKQPMPENGTKNV